MWWPSLLVALCFCTIPITPKREDHLKTVGDTEGYNVASDLLTKAMNFTVDPCEDFFEFACGSWIATHPIPSYTLSYTQSTIVFDKVQKKMRGFGRPPRC
ncbi:hypothetical protein ANCDUO_01903 [Ancylostoma duodenale]|uniref:Peptidase M13 N-terminal domain-containing protein n=1 Tax=Ancylostoma duodenale TaxID=51022 RepID=A0A0C2H1W1_9BILA|nr:hypothetical protein ANCDUO_01903 [Ancylostoma duodenale]